MTTTTQPTPAELLTLPTLEIRASGVPVARFTPEGITLGGVQVTPVQARVIAENIIARLALKEAF